MHVYYFQAELFKIIANYYVSVHVRICNTSADRLLIELKWQPYAKELCQLICYSDRSAASRSSIQEFGMPTKLGINKL